MHPHRKPLLLFEDFFIYSLDVGNYKAWRMTRIAGSVAQLCMSGQGSPFGSPYRPAKELRCGGETPSLD